MEKILNNLWVEKYRPKKLEDVVLSEKHKSDFEKYIERGEIGCLLFSGTPGTGKSTLARILCSKNGVLYNRNDNLLEINGSSKETRGISYVQDVIEPFLKVPPAKPDKHKIVFIDEGDFLTDHSQTSLRGIIEKYSLYGRFVFTCNYLSKILDAIQSRCTLYNFKQIPLDFVINYCKDILEKESIVFNVEDIKFVVNSLYPDIRKVVNVLQRCSISGKLKVDKKSVTTKEKVISASIVEIIGNIERGDNSKISRCVNDVINIINKEEPDYRSIYSTLFFMDKIPAPAKIIINRYSNSHQGCLVTSMHFISMIFEIIKVLQEYKKSVGR